MVDGVGSEANERSLCHSIDFSENRIEGRGVSCGEGLAAGDGGNDGDFGGGVAATDVDGINGDIIFGERLGDFDIVAIGEIEALSIGEEDDHAVTDFRFEEVFFGLLECLADGGAATEPIGELAGVEERRGVAEGGDVGGERDPAEVVVAKDEERKGVAFSVSEEFVERIHRDLVAILFSKRGGHGT